MTDLDPDLIAAHIYARLRSHAAADPDPLGYAVVELDVTGKHPEPFGPSDMMLVIDPSLEKAKEKRGQLPAFHRDRYVICKLIPVEPGEETLLS